MFQYKPYILLFNTRTRMRNEYLSYEKNLLTQINLKVQ